MQADSADVHAAASEVVAEDLAEAARAAAGKILLVCIGRGKSRSKLRTSVLVANTPTSALRCALPFLRGLRPQAPAF